jgi:hypothetical protein
MFATTVLGQATGGIRGRVIDENAQPVAGAQVELKPGSRRTVSDEDGRFTFRNLTSGTWTIDVRRIGYRALSTQVSVADSDATPAITLVAIPQILDSVRIRERASALRYSATVLDDAGRPVPDVAVMVAGVDNKIRTDSAGHFVVPKMVRGTLMIRMRKIGYSAYFGTLRMLAEREDTLRMSRLAQTLSAVQILEESGFGHDTFVYRDLDQRMRWRNHQSGVISREELDAQGRVQLCTALSFTPTGGKYGVRCEGACVILNGEERTLMPVAAFYADQVESVEYYPPKSDWSGNLGARGCNQASAWTRGGRTTVQLSTRGPQVARGPAPQLPVLVIWMRKEGAPKNGLFATTDSVAAPAEADKTVTPGRIAEPSSPNTIAGMIDGIVTDTNLVPLATADVSILRTAIRIATGNNGRFRITAVPAGQYLLTVRKLGYHPMVKIVDVTAADTLRLSVFLDKAPTALDTVVVTGKSRSLRMAEFDHRRETERGQFLTEEDISKRNSVSATELLRTFLSVDVKMYPGGGGQMQYFAMSRRVGPAVCPMQVYVDGVAMPSPFSLDLLPSPRNLAGIELYSGPATTPPQFGGANRRCGVILVWTRDGS